MDINILYCIKQSSLYFYFEIMKAKINKIKKNIKLKI